MARRLDADHVDDDDQRRPGCWLVSWNWNHRPFGK